MKRKIGWSLLFTLFLVLLLGCSQEDNSYVDHHKETSLEVAYLEDKQSVGLTVNLPTDSITWVYVMRSDIGESTYITYEMEPISVEDEWIYPKLKKGTHVIEDPFISAGKSYTYYITFYDDNTGFIYESPEKTITVPVDSGVTDVLANCTVSNINGTWYKEAAVLTIPNKPTFSDPPENFSLDLWLYYGKNIDESLSFILNEDEEDEEDKYPFEQFLPPYNNMLGEEIPFLGGLILLEGDLSEDENSPTRRFWYGKKILPTELNGCPQSIEMISKDELLSRVKGDWYNTEFGVTTFNSDRTYSSTPTSTSGKILTSGSFYIDNNAFNNISFKNTNGKVFLSNCFFSESDVISFTLENTYDMFYYIKKIDTLEDFPFHIDWFDDISSSSLKLDGNNFEYEYYIMDDYDNKVIKSGTWSNNGNYLTFTIDDEVAFEAIVSSSYDKKAFVKDCTTGQIYQDAWYFSE